MRQVPRFTCRHAAITCAPNTENIDGALRTASRLPSNNIRQQQWQSVTSQYSVSHTPHFRHLDYTQCATAYLPFLWALPARTRWLFILSGAIYIGGAVGVEWATIWYEENDQLNTLAYNLWNAVEESMEMTGVILFIYALLGHIAANPKTTFLKVRFDR